MIGCGFRVVLTIFLKGLLLGGAGEFAQFAFLFLSQLLQPAQLLPHSVLLSLLACVKRAELEFLIESKPQLCGLGEAPLVWLCVGGRDGVWVVVGFELFF